jgi:DNA-binding XRE family transcriptional regulator
LAKRGPGTPAQPAAARARAGRPRKAAEATSPSNDAPAELSAPIPSEARGSQPAEDDLLAIFGENLRRARLAADLSQVELASQTGLTQQYLSLIEAGQKNVTLRTMMTLAKVLGQDVSTMLQRSGWRLYNRP